MTQLGLFGLGSTEILVILLFLIVLGLFLLPYIFYLLTISRTLKQCAQHNQKMSPGQVWLVFIPLFGLVWHFIVVNRVADSLAAEYYMRNIPREEQRPGYNVGLAFNILSLCGWIPFLGVLASLAGLVCWIVYWVKIARYKKVLEEHKFQFGMGNPNPYEFPNRFPGQK